MKNSVRGLLLVTGGMIAGALISASLAAPERAARTVLPLDEIRQFTDIYGAVKQYYVDPVEDKKLMKEAISGMLQGLDPHSAYLDENAFNELQEGTTGEFGGLGLEVPTLPVSKLFLRSTIRLQRGLICVQGTLFSKLTERSLRIFLSMTP